MVGKFYLGCEMFNIPVKSGRPKTIDSEAKPHAIEYEKCAQFKKYAMLYLCLAQEI